MSSPSKVSTVVSTSATADMEQLAPPIPQSPRTSWRIVLTVVLVMVAVMLAGLVLAIALVGFGRSTSSTGEAGGFEVDSQTSIAGSSSEPADDVAPAPEPSDDGAPAQPSDGSTGQQSNDSTERGSDADDAENSAAAPTRTGLQPLTLRGMGSITFGMTVAEAGEALGTAMEFGEAVSDACFYGWDPTDVTSPLFMVLTTTGDPADGTITRLDVGEAHNTRAGIHFGSSKSEVLEAYGDRIVASPHPYDSSPGSEYLTFVPGDQVDSQYRLIFETRADRVIGMRAGLLPSIEWIEGCL